MSGSRRSRRRRQKGPIQRYERGSWAPIRLLSRSERRTGRKKILTKRSNASSPGRRETEARLLRGRSDPALFLFLEKKTPPPPPTTTKKDNQEESLRGEVVSGEEQSRLETGGRGGWGNVSHIRLENEVLGHSSTGQQQPRSAPVFGLLSALKHATVSFVWTRSCWRRGGGFKSRPLHLHLLKAFP